MNIISYNVNGIRAAINKGFVDWLKRESPDVICLQETKSQNENFPSEDFVNQGMKHLYYRGEKSYNGVAILSKIKMLNNYVKEFKSNKNLILVTHYVLISEVLNYAPSSGEIVISDKNFNMLGSIEINY